jgi:DASH complex subunit ASK1
MAQPPHNPLLHPPFFEIPGINPSSPLSTQMEQIDQLNTLLLQEIDANFAKFHQIVTARILPEIKRFAIAGEPTREAAHVSYFLHGRHS